MKTDPVGVTVRSGTNREMPVRERWVLWHVTRNCNIECGYCYGSFSGSSYKELGRDGGELDTDRAKQLFAELSTARIDAVHINGGEPLLRGDLVTILKAGRDLPIRKWLLTNGTVRGPALTAIAKDGLVDVLAISLDSNVDTVNDAVRQRSTRARETLEILASWRSSGESSARLGVYVVVSKANLPTLGSYAKWLADLGVDYVNVQPVFLPAGHPQEHLSLNQSDVDCLHSFYDRLGENSHMTTSSKDMQWLATSTIGGQNGRAKNCFADRGDYFYIAPSGLVYGCPVKSDISIALGSLHRSTFDAVAKSKAPEQLDCHALCGDCLGMYEMASAPLSPG